MDDLQLNFIGIINNSMKQNQILLKVNNFIQSYDNMLMEEQFRKARLKQNIMFKIMAAKNKQQYCFDQQQKSISVPQKTARIHHQLNHQNLPSTPKTDDNNVHIDLQKKVTQSVQVPNKAKQNDLQKPNLIINGKENTKKQMIKIQKNEEQNQFSHSTQLKNKSKLSHKNDRQMLSECFEQSNITNQKLPRSADSSLAGKKYSAPDLDVNDQSEGYEKDRETLNKSQNNIQNKVQQITFKNTSAFFNHDFTLSQAKPDSDLEQAEQINKVVFKKQNQVGISQSNKNSQIHMNLDSEEQVQSTEVQPLTKSKWNNFMAQAKQIQTPIDWDQNKQENQQNPKNIAFEIVMEKPQTIHSIEEMRKQKILYMDRKRQERLGEGKHQVKAQNSKLKNSHSYGKKTKSECSQSPHNPPKAQELPSEKDSKKDKKETRRNPPSYPHESLIDNQEKDQAKNITTSQILIQAGLPRSPYKASKSTQQDQKKPTRKDYSLRDHSPGRQNYRLKSCNKFLNEPKIQPKQRKNAFTKQSNKKLMVNAITYACLPGELNRKQRQRFVQVIESAEHQFIVLLFKQYSRKVVKGIFYLQGSKLVKIFGEKAPQQIRSEQIDHFYRYDSGARQFKLLDGNKSLSLVVHAIDIK